MHLAPILGTTQHTVKHMTGAFSTASPPVEPKLKLCTGAQHMQGRQKVPTTPERKHIFSKLPKQYAPSAHTQICREVCFASLTDVWYIPTTNTWYKFPTGDKYTMGTYAPGCVTDCTNKILVPFSLHFTSH